MITDKFYSEVAPMLVKLGWVKYDGGIWQHKDGKKMGHWMDIILYHMGFCVTLETSNTDEQSKRFKKLLTDRN